MDWQQAAALGVVALTLGLIAWRRFRPHRFNFHRDTGCGCSSATNPPGLVVHGRRGEKPKITVKSS